MKTYAQLYIIRETRYSPKLHKIVPCMPYKVELVGSDGVIHLDGRKSLATLNSEIMESIKNNPHKVCGYDIRVMINKRYTDRVLIKYKEL